MNSECRRIFCPLNQFELSDGTCTYAAKELHIEVIDILIRLTPVIPADSERLKRLSVATFNVRVIDESWSGISGVLKSYYCRHIFEQTDGCFFDIFILTIRIRRVTMESRKFYSAIEEGFTKKITWQLGNVTMEFRQTFQRSTSFERYKKTDVYLYKVHTDDVYLREVVVDNENVFNVGDLTKHFFCSLIELTVNDFFFTNYGLIYKPTNGSFFDGE